jgi:hypothetical protein
MEQHALKMSTIVGIPTFLFLETPGGQNYNLYKIAVNVSTPVLIRHLWQLKTVVFLHRCVICAVLLELNLLRAYTMVGSSLGLIY